MEKIYLYNTRAQEKQEFTSFNDKEVRMYHCGPTVYGTQHLGNLRAFVVWDILRRVLEYNGYTTKQIINITDVGHLVSDGDTGEDKMTKGLNAKGWDITLDNMLRLGREFEEKYISDLEKLNIRKADAFPRASEHIDEDINIIKALEEKGFIYETSSGIYFDTTKDPGYGKAFCIHNEEDNSRIQGDPEKRNHKDFALWKFNDSLGWDSPWGKGFPGWHIECSAMSEKYLGLPFDIHTGGIEHIAIHHTNEIAQSENARDSEMARFWLHNNHLQINGEKISKSLGNTLYLDDVLEKGYSPLDFRYLLLGTHYKKELNFTWEALEAASVARKRLKNHTQHEKGEVHEVYKENFLKVINDDLNTPQALAIAWEVARDEDISPEDKAATLLDFDTVLGLGLDIKEEILVPEEISDLAQSREEARKNKDFEKADALRKSIQEKGFDVKDTEKGPEIFPL